MKDWICIAFASGQKICFKIPLYVYPFPVYRPPNPPDPPYPWLEINDLRPEVESDIRTLAAIHELSNSLSAELRASIQRELKVQAGKLPLPEGISVEFRRGGG